MSSVCTNLFLSHSQIATTMNVKLRAVIKANANIMTEFHIWELLATFDETNEQSVTAANCSSRTIKGFVNTSSVLAGSYAGRWMTKSRRLLRNLFLWKRLCVWAWLAAISGHFGGVIPIQPPSYFKHKVTWHWNCKTGRSAYLKTWYAFVANRREES